MFIVLEGIDGSGKTTLSASITQYLNSSGKQAKRFSEPTSYETGIFIRKFLSGEIQLSKKEQIDKFLLDRVESVSRNILPSLQSGAIVVLDRYYYSTAAYQASSEFPPESILQLNINKNFPKPDILFFLNIPPNTALERLGNRGVKREIFETLENLEKIHLNFMKILPQNAHILDGTLEPSKLLEISIQIVQSQRFKKF